MVVLSDRQRLEFEAAARPLVEWLNENCHPHVMAIIEPDHAQLFEGSYSLPIIDYIKD